MITSYRSGRDMEVSGKRYQSDLKIIDGRVVPEWWRRQGHRLDAADIADILSERPDVLVIGTGYAGQMRVPEATRRTLADADIRVVAKQTPEAVTAFNELAASGERVAGAFHLTC